MVGYWPFSDQYTTSADQNNQCLVIPTEHFIVIFIVLIIKARLWYTQANYHSVFHYGVYFAYHKILKLVMGI